MGRHRQQVRRGVAQHGIRINREYERTASGQLIRTGVPRILGLVIRSSDVLFARVADFRGVHHKLVTGNFRILPLGSLPKQNCWRRGDATHRRTPFSLQP